MISQENLNKWLSHFRKKFKPVLEECTAEEKEKLLKRLGSDYIVRIDEVFSPGAQKLFKVVYIPKMTTNEIKQFIKLKNSNAITARKSLTWEMLNVRAGKFLKELNKNFEEIPKKNIQFSNGSILSVLDLTQQDDYAWLIHVTETSATNLQAMNKQITEGILWEQFPFLSCSVQDGHTASYSSFQGNAHTQQPFPISLVLSVDPNGVMGTFKSDARTPDNTYGYGKTAHLLYIPEKTADLINSDLTNENRIPDATLEESSSDKSLKSVDRLLSNTTTGGYNEVVVLTGELAKAWGVKPLKISAILIEKKMLDQYLEQQDQYLPQNKESNQNAINSLVEFSQQHNLPILLIDPTPKPKLVDEMYRVQQFTIPFKRKPSNPFQIKRSNIFKQELKDFLDEFIRLSNDQTIPLKNREWYQDKANLIERILSTENLIIPRDLIMEDKILLKIIIENTKLDNAKENAAILEDTLPSIDDTSERENIQYQYQRLKEDAKIFKRDLKIYTKELNTHFPHLDFKVKEKFHGKI